MAAGAAMRPEGSASTLTCSCASTRACATILFAACSRIVPHVCRVALGRALCRQKILSVTCVSRLFHLYDLVLDIELRFVVCIIILREIYTERTQHT